LESSQPFALALLRTLIHTKKNDRHPELTFNRWCLDDDEWTTWAYANYKGYLLKCFKTAALLNDSEYLVDIVQEYDGCMKAKNHPKLKLMAPTDCFFIDEITTQPNDLNLTDSRAWLAVALKVDGESLMKLATNTRITDTPFKLILR
jgi:hypothetical protein